MTLLKKMITLSVYSLSVILLFNFLLKLSPSYSFSLNSIATKVTKDSSLEQNLLKESQAGVGYFHIPLKNRRQIRIRNLMHLNEPERTERIESYKQVIVSKTPLYEDKEAVKALELELLSRGLWAICDWKFEMPPPFSKDKQCTQAELKFLLENSEADSTGIGQMQRDQLTNDGPIPSVS